MKKFRLEGTDIWFGYTEENHDRAVAKARFQTEAHPDAKIIYNHDRSNSTDPVDSNKYSTAITQLTVPKSARNTKTTKKTVQLPDLSSDLDESGFNADAV